MPYQTLFIFLGIDIIIDFAYLLLITMRKRKSSGGGVSLSFPQSVLAIIALLSQCYDVDM